VLIYAYAMMNKCSSIKQMLWTDVHKQI